MRPASLETLLGPFLLASLIFIFVVLFWLRSRKGRK